MNFTKQAQFKKFLVEELAISKSALALAEKQGEQTPNLMAMILWQYGLVSLEQLERIWNWMSAAY